MADRRRCTARGVSCTSGRRPARSTTWIGDAASSTPLRALPHDCVVFTHFIAINVAAAAAQRREEVVCFRPDHASVTVLDAGSEGLRLVELGREAQTGVLAR